MVETFVPKTRKTLSGMGEVPMNAGRYALFTETIEHDDGTQEVRQWAEQVPESSQPYFWIPSLGCISEDEMRYLAEEYAYDREHPSDEQLEWDAERRAKKRYAMQLYNELRDKRAELIRNNPRTLGGRG